MKQAVQCLTALAQASRLRVFRLLAPAGEEGMPAGLIAESLDLPPATLTFHLKELVNAGLLVSHREGRSIIYSLRVDGMKELLTFLTQDCCGGRPELCCLPQISKPKKAGAKRRRRAST